MNKNPNFEESDAEIKAQLSALTEGEEPSDALMRKLRFAAKVAKPVRTPWWQSRMSFAVAGLAVAVVTGVALLPAQASAKTYAKVVEAVNRTNAFQISIQSPEKGDQDGLTIAGEDGRFCMRTNDGSLMEFANGAMSVYDQKEKTLTRLKFGKSIPMEELGQQIHSGFSEGFKQMDLKKMLREYGEKYGRDSIQITPERWQDGRRVYFVTLASKQEKDRVHLTVDAATDLPRRMEVEGRDDNGNWHRATLMEMRFGNEVDPSLLRANFPKDAKVEEIDLGGLIEGAMKGLEGLGNIGNKPPKP
jgi:hypothetical protein